MLCRWIVGIVKVFMNNTIELAETNNRKSIQAEVYFEATPFHNACHQRHYRKCAIGARTMHGLGTDVVKNPAV